MKYSVIFTTIIILALSNQAVIAGSIANPSATGEILTATKMNEIRDAVNDNDNRVDSNTSNISINSDNISSNTVDISNIPAASGLTFVNNNDGANCHILTNTSVNTAKTTIEAPSDGFVFVTFSAYSYISHTNGTADRMKLGLSDTSAVSVSEGVRLLNVTSSAPTDLYYESINTQQVYPVVSGSINTYYVNSEMQFGGNGTSRLCHYNLTAIFVP